MDGFEVLSGSRPTRGLSPEDAGDPDLGDSTRSNYVVSCFKLGAEDSPDRPVQRGVRQARIGLVWKRSATGNGDRDLDQIDTARRACRMSAARDSAAGNRHRAQDEPPGKPKMQWFPPSRGRRRVVQPTSVDFTQYCESARDGRRRAPLNSSWNHGRNVPDRMRSRTIKTERRASWRSAAC